MEKGHQRTKLKVQLAIGMLRIGSAENCSVIMSMYALCDNVMLIFHLWKKVDYD